MNAEAIRERFAQRGYVADADFATALELVLALEKPLLVEGPAGVGKTESAKVLADVLETRLIRLQCYEGLDAANALYEWNYPKQLLHIRLTDGDGTSAREREAQIFSEAISSRARCSKRSRKNARRCCSSTRSIAPTKRSRRFCSSCWASFK